MRVLGGGSSVPCPHHGYGATSEVTHTLLSTTLAQNNFFRLCQMMQELQSFYKVGGVTIFPHPLLSPLIPHPQPLPSPPITLTLPSPPLSLPLPPKSYFARIKETVQEGLKTFLTKYALPCGHCKW